MDFMNEYCGYFKKVFKNMGEMDYIVYLNNC